MGRTASPRTSETQQLLTLLGNQEIAERLAAGNTHRDELLLLIGRELQTVRGLQLAEEASIRRRANWLGARLIADPHKQEFTKPEPQRWGPVGIAWNKALETVARGDLRRGRLLVEDALQLQAKVAEATTRLAMDEERARSVGSASVPGGPDHAEGCNAPPELQDLVREIVDTSTSMPNLPRRRRIMDPWWMWEEEEEEEDE